MRVMIAGGGTGGHVYPGVAIYRALQRRIGGVEVLFVGAKSGVEATILRDLGLPHILLAGRGLRGTSVAARLAGPFLVMAGVVRGIRHIADFRPDVVIGTGGYASFATVMAAVLTARRRVLQEQNSVPGLANRVLSRFAHLVLLAYDDSRQYLARRVRSVVVGNPLRINTETDRSTAAARFGLDPAVQTVLIVGGSRGAHSLNMAAVEAIPRLVAERPVQFVLLTGVRDHERVQAALSGHEGVVRVIPFLEDIGPAYAAADLAVARAGASTVFELAAFGVPTVFVPYPYAADDHQRLNAEPLTRDGKALLLNDRDLDGDRLVAVIESLLDDPERRARMSAGMRGWAKIDAAERAADEVIEVARSRFSAENPAPTPRVGC